jgi:hypothetical protein
MFTRLCKIERYERQGTGRRNISSFAMKPTVPKLNTCSSLLFTNSNKLETFYVNRGETRREILGKSIIFLDFFLRMGSKHICTFCRNN